MLKYSVVDIVTNKVVAKFVIFDYADAYVEMLHNREGPDGRTYIIRIE